MKIICVDRGDNIHITKGKTYSTENKAEDSHYVVIADDGMVHHYRAERFAEVKDEAPPTYPTKVVEPGGGMKFDGGKPDFRTMLHPLLLGCLDGLLGVLSILEFGAIKYAANSWQKLENAEARYMQALMRHQAAIIEHGLLHKDEESGKLSIFHLACDSLFLATFAYRKAKAQAEKDTH